jgi:hypothetical protein
MQNSLVLLFVLLAQNAFAERWNAMNDPSIMDPDFVFELKRLPKEGALERTPWSETYWASKKGSINIRWNTEKQEGFRYESPSRAQVMTMSREQLSRLSPSEKFDLFLGRYDYPLKKEVSGIASPMAKWWSGLCDGWSLAALQYAEPKPVDVLNPDGIVIPFGSSDVKGLMSYAAAQRFDVETRQVGGRCSTTGRIFSTPGCEDINAGSLHIVLSNMIGIRKQGIVTERDPAGQIWNQATYAFKTSYLGSAKPDVGSTGIRVHTTLIYVDELEESSWDPVVASGKNKEGKMELDYILDLDSNGNIIGGSYLSEIHPDFVWLPINRFELKTSLDGLERIYQPNN